MEYKLKAERVRKGIKQGELAKRLGITPQYLCKIEKGVADPRRELMLEIAHILQADVRELFFNEDGK
ncbi:helix-turn-helix transcriptional regulator [Clostridium tyrobutyricum]|uniref:helix-turn-helix transcriptional regulator n=1 Tax=Clostridium tyrobutyricum TaxID=1519 RepID=UPI001C38CAEC|nr:helix-turn-helix transcriptional regulator [Clostridium tyrobutyricum]MBV4439328.1 helix-turn-helix transcriptional regulator [Clostridium tyrobutyricum]